MRLVFMVVSFRCLTGLLISPSRCPAMFSIVSVFGVVAAALGQLSSNQIDPHKNPRNGLKFHRPGYKADLVYGRQY
jgi:hypothetical protein